MSEDPNLKILPPARVQQRGLFRYKLYFRRDVEPLTDLQDAAIQTAISEVGSAWFIKGTIMGFIFGAALAFVAVWVVR